MNLNLSTLRLRLTLPSSAHAQAAIFPPLSSILAASLTLLLTGCTVLSYTGPNGERFSRSSLGATTSIASLCLESSSNGVRRVELRGYQSESAQALGAVTEAAVRAAIQGAK
jgi:hypothetical protein